MYFFWQGWKTFCPPWMQIPLGVSHKSSPFWKETRAFLTFPPIQNPKRFSTSHSTWHWLRSKKYNPPYSTTHQLFFWAFTPSSEPPFLLGSCGPLEPCFIGTDAMQFTLEVQNLPLSVGVCEVLPIIMRSAAHNWQTFVLTVLTGLIVLDRQRISTLMLVWHHSATSAFLLNSRFLTWAMRWQASADQLSCRASRLGVAIIARA